MTTVRTASAAVAAMSTRWEMVRALLGGTAAMRAAGKAYLPQWPNESDEGYRARLAVATLYPAFSRTVEVLAGKPFSKTLAFVGEAPAQVVGWAENIDMQGNSLHVFAAELLREVIGFGAGGVLVDFPRADGVRTLADEQAMGARPYFVRYPPGTVLGWRTERRGSAMRLTQLRLLEVTEEPAGDFGVQSVERVRVLTPGAWALWEKAPEKDEWVPVDAGTTTLDEIPFVFFGARSGSFGVPEIPLLELAYLNVEHWQSSSDQQTLLHVARVPILTVIGADDAQITVGAASAVKLPQGGDLKFVEHSGAAIEAGRQSLLDLEERMRQAGAELLVLKPGQVTATQTRSESEANRCALQRIVEDVEDGLDQCLQFAARWVGLPDGGNVSIHKDFGVTSMAEAMKELITMNLSDQTRFEEAQRRGLIAPDRTWEDEKERIEQQGPALGAME